MDSLGLRIRKLRKQQKLTLEALAGDQLTKGMLSLIENGKAQPSMESLSYIAKRLGIESSELMEDVSQTEKRSLLAKVEKLYKVDFSDLMDEHQQITELVQPVVDKLSISYESARLLEIYSKCGYYLKRDDWETYYNQAMKLYEQLHLYNQWASLAMFKGLIKFNLHAYEEALSIILEEHARFDSPSIKLDAVTTLDYMYIESILYSAVGKYEESQLKMNEALIYSKEERIFYRIDDLYRFAGAQAIINGNDADREYYLRKVRQYGEFAENLYSTAMAELLEAHYYNSYAHEYDKALTHIERFLELGNELYKNTEDTNHYLLEKGKSLYGLGQINKALTLLNQYKIPDYIHHPLDLSMSYEVHAYRAKCYAKLGDKEKAVNEAKIGHDLILPLPETPYKTFILHTYNDLLKSSDSF